MSRLTSLPTLSAFALACVLSAACAAPAPEVKPYVAGEMSGDPAEPTWIATSTGLYDNSGTLALMAVGNAPVMENARSQDIQARRAAAAELTASVTARVDRIAGACADLLAQQFTADYATAVVKADIMERARNAAIKVIGDPEVPARYKCETKTAKAVGQLWVLVKTDAASLVAAVREILWNDVNQAVTRNGKGLKDPDRDAVLQSLKTALDGDISAWLGEKQPGVKLP